MSRTRAVGAEGMNVLKMKMDTDGEVQGVCTDVVTDAERREGHWDLRRHQGSETHPGGVW